AFPTTEADVVEIDPGMTKLAEEYFDLNREDFPSLSIIHEDARIYLNRTHEPYDLIYVAVYGSSKNIPVHVTTKGMFEGLSQNLREDGVAFMNIISSPQGPGSAFAGALMNTAREVFPYATLYSFSGSMTERQNLIVALSKKRAFASLVIDPRYGSMRIAAVEPEASSITLTDNYAPVEYLVSQ
ncbi:MAG: fused MFS/spermidine synthase, partial [Patescibacteria group bacterium]